ncbi:hypothetical protein [Paeniglutamicibacter kerguelensis]|uniref:Uncharacterized protein n=1 Tax=Paeniglutamicibacter kerguelensis TaxID=254788 RepID=A0ABS4X8M7_9MICC|nr:hypothetical protein [Paeniglutamicibacter kerguelensis]MBP2384822.1 hypothetical protein [Paeniglutamicibacter kerguelensis]
MWPQHKVEVYEQMVAELRSTLGEQAPNIPPRVLAELEGIIQAAVHTIENGAEIVAIGLPELEPESGPNVAAEAVGGSAVVEPVPVVAEPVAEPAPVKPAIDPFRHGTKAEANRQQKAKELARWLWDRNIGGEQVLGFTNKWRNKIARAAGVNPPSTLETWTVAAELMGRMEQLADSGTQPGASERHHLDEHEQWATER